MSDTVTVVVPSATVPGAPAFSVAVPSGWVAEPGPGVLASFAVGGRPEWSVVVSTTRVARDTTLRDVAVRTFARQRTQHPDAVIRTQRTGTFDDRLTYLREVRLPSAAGAEIAQLQVLFTVPVPGTSELHDVVSIVASCEDGQLDQLGPSVIDLVASFRTVETTAA